MKPERKRGRRPLDPTDPSVSVCLKLPSKYYASLLRKADGLRRSVPEHIRRTLARRAFQDI